MSRATMQKVNRAIWAGVIVLLLFVLIALLTACGPRDEHREKCDKAGGAVGTQYDHNHNVKAHTCIVHGKTVDVWSASAPTPEPNWQ